MVHCNIVHKDLYPPEPSSTVHCTSHMHLVLNLPLDGIVIDHYYSVTAEFFPVFFVISVIFFKYTVLPDSGRCIFSDYRKTQYLDYYVRLNWFYEIEVHIVQFGQFGNSN